MAIEPSTYAIGELRGYAVPVERGYGLEDGLAEAIFFLSGDRSGYITGQVLAVDGGFDAAGIGLRTLRGRRRNG